MDQIIEILQFFRRKDIIYRNLNLNKNIINMFNDAIDNSYKLCTISFKSVWDIGNSFGFAPCPDIHSHLVKLNMKEFEVRY